MQTNRSGSFSLQRIRRATGCRFCHFMVKCYHVDTKGHRNVIAFSSPILGEISKGLTRYVEDVIGHRAMAMYWGGEKWIVYFFALLRVQVGVE